MIDTKLVEELTRLTLRASEAVLAIPRAALGVRDKHDRSPVTVADEASNDVIAAGLASLLPGIPVVSEETANCALVSTADMFVLVDPLDGTKEFIAGHDEYTINIAIISAGAPIAGFMAAPARGLIYHGMPGRGAERIAFTGNASSPTPIRCRIVPPTGPVALVSRSHLDASTEAFLDTLKIAERMVCGSALKFGYLAQGKADVYVRLGPTSEWDIAAGHAILVAAGGEVLRPDGAPLTYGGGRDGTIIPSFAAWGDPALAARCVRTS